MNPLEDAIVALRPIGPNNHPFKVPNSVRLLDPTQPLNGTMNFTNINPLGNPVPVINLMTNFGWEYVDHCHLLGHEENDMMRPMCFVVAPEAPSGLNAVGVPGRIQLNWTNNALNPTSLTIERALDSAFTNTLVSFTPASATATTYNDTTAVIGTPYFYRIKANNTVGSTVATGYPTMTGVSNPSNTASATRPS